MDADDELAGDVPVPNVIGISAAMIESISKSQETALKLASAFSSPAAQRLNEIGAKFAAEALAANYGGLQKDMSRLAAYDPPMQLPSFPMPPPNPVHESNRYLAEVTAILAEAAAATAEREAAVTARETAAAARELKADAAAAVRDRASARRERLMLMLTALAVVVAVLAWVLN